MIKYASGFNSDMHKKGGKIISVDPIYQFSVEKIKQRINEAYEDVKRQAEKNKDCQRKRSLLTMSFKRTAMKC